MTIELRPAGDRPFTEVDGRRTFHSFSFGAHYDPDNVGFAAMSAHNDENLLAGAGYDAHPHSDVEILTWVVDGVLLHTDSSGRTAALGPGEVFRTSAGSGIVHSEMAEPGTATRFLQTWLRPDEPGVSPSYDGARLTGETGLVELVGRDGAIGIGTRGARLHLGRLDVGSIELPDAGKLHLFVVDGEVAIGDRTLCPGDAARLLGEGGRALRVETDALVSVWAFD